MADILDKLHDAVVDRITFVWADRRIELAVSVFVRVDEPARAYTIMFHNVRRLVVPREAPWGDSRSINAVERVDDVFRIEMQSGDVIEVAAASITANGR